MRQLVTVAPGQLEVRWAAEPEPTADEAVVAVEAVGICGSDVHLFTGDHPYSRFPNVQGHEIGGRVVSLPGGYRGLIEIGGRVAVEPLLMCGECLPCRRGRGNCCVRMQTYGAHIDGGLADRIAVKADLLHDAEGLSAELAALVEPMSIGLHAVGRASVGSDDTVVIYGAGPIGQAILLAAADLGASVMVIDRLGSRLDLATELGAQAVANAADGDVERAVAAWTGGEGPMVVFEATGVPAVMEEAVRVVASSGTVVVVGLSRRSVSLPMVEFTRKELTVVGSRNNMGRFGDAVDLVRRRRDRVQRLISHRFPLERGPEAFALAHSSPQTTAKIIIEVAATT